MCERTKVLQGTGDLRTVCKRCGDLTNNNGAICKECAGTVPDPKGKPIVPFLEERGRHDLLAYLKVVAVVMLNPKSTGAPTAIPPEYPVRISPKAFRPYIRQKANSIAESSANYNGSHADMVTEHCKLVEAG